MFVNGAQSLRELPNWTKARQHRRKILTFVCVNVPRAYYEAFLKLSIEASHDSISNWNHHEFLWVRSSFVLSLCSCILLACRSECFICRVKWVGYIILPYNRFIPTSCRFCLQHNLRILQAATSEVGLENQNSIKKAFPLSHTQKLMKFMFFDVLFCSVCASFVLAFDYTRNLLW